MRILEVDESPGVKALKAYIAKTNDALKKQDPVASISSLFNTLHFAVAIKLTINDVPELGELLESTKTAWITSILKNIADNEGLYDTMSLIRHNVYSLIAVGLKWPELQIIARSVNIMSKGHSEIDEESNNQPDDSLYIQWFIRELVNGSAKSTYYAMQDLIDNNVDKTEIAKALKSKTDDLLEFIIYKLWDWGDVIIKTFEFLDTLPMGITNDVLAKIDEDKPNIIKGFLLNIKDGYYHRVIDILNIFRWLEISWPELDAIERSMNAINSQNPIDEGNERQWSLEEHRMYIWKSNVIDTVELHKIWRLESLLYYADKINANISSVMPIIQRYKRFIIREILSQLRNTPLSDMRRLIETYNKHGIIWPELEIIKASIEADIKSNAHNDVDEGRIRNNINKQTYIKNLSDFIDDNSIDNPNYYNSERSIISNIYDLLYYANDYNITINDLPKLNEYLEKYKTKLIINMLEFIKSGKIDMLSFYIKRLKGVGIQWSELDIINRSVQELTKTKISENEVATLIPDHINVLLRYIDRLTPDSDPLRGALVDILHYARANGITTENVPELGTFLENNKSKIITGMLQSFMNHNHAHPFHYPEIVEKLIERLYSVGIEWPELDVINRSVQEILKQQYKLDIND